jgi:hypothetical protein
MRFKFLALSFLPLLAISLPAAAQNASAQSGGTTEVRRNAQEQTPADIIGVWKLDLQASKFEGNAPKAQYRIFDYTRDGMFMCMYITLNARGEQTSGIWAVKLDGSDGIKYTRPYGSTPFAIVTLKKVDENTLDLTAGRYGKVFETGQFKISPDTLTFTYHAGGRTTVAVYHRWNMLD